MSDAMQHAWAARDAAIERERHPIACPRSDAGNRASCPHGIERDDGKHCFGCPLRTPKSEFLKREEW